MSGTRTVQPGVLVSIAFRPRSLSGRSTGIMRRPTSANTWVSIAFRPRSLSGLLITKLGTGTSWWGLNSLSAKVPFGTEGPSGHEKYCSRWACLKGGRFSSVFRDAGRDCSRHFQDLYRHVSEQQAGRNLRLKAEAGFRRFRRALQIPTGAPRHVPVVPEAPSRPSTEKETTWKPSPKGEMSPSPVRPPAAGGSRTCRLPALQGLKRAGVPDCKHFH